MNIEDAGRGAVDGHDTVYLGNSANKHASGRLGNDDDGEEKIPVPVKTVDKQTPRTAKRNVEPQPPTRGPGGNRRGGPGGNEGAFRDRDAGSGRNHGRSTEEQSGPRGPRGGAGARVRGGRGSRRPRDSDDRHTKSATQGGSDKQAAASWGAAEGTAELKDEQAGDAIAQTEQKDAAAEDAAEEAAEPEDKSVSYSDYLAQQAEKKLTLEDSLNIREANEGSKLDKKWQSAKPLENHEEEYHAGGHGKKQRERERKVKQTVDFDPRFVEPERTRGGARGGRGGGRGRGEGRGGRGGNFRGGRGGRDAPAASINTKDESAFPSLGK
ncbi:unnamed protein product [Clonostachys solani]|uniref:Hyaluronan/mRNA-binding protein domain-containing protein n=1 Tax=Clonostachys solani TaxID=160281 RepID=A0A9N9Z4U8_9HYPO|nr:unnamed protein product [Clonostachys solani]